MVPVDAADLLPSGDLDDPKVKKDYERGYEKLLHFFHEHL